MCVRVCVCVYMSDGCVYVFMGGGSHVTIMWWCHVTMQVEQEVFDEEEEDEDDDEEDVDFDEDDEGTSLQI